MKIIEARVLLSFFIIPPFFYLNIFQIKFIIKILLVTARSQKKLGITYLGSAFAVLICHNHKQTNSAIATIALSP